MIGVQLIGKDAVLSRFNKLETDTWALYQGKQFIVGGIGQDDLVDWLDDFTTSGSTATYLLRVYDSDTVPTSSTANSNYIASINFKLVDQYEGMGIGGHNTKLMQRLDGIEKKLAGRDDDESEDLNSIIMGWLSDPNKLAVVAGVIRDTLGRGSVQPAIIANQLPAGQTVSGFNVSSDQPEDTEEKLTRLSKALDYLETKDAKLIGHLEKLAKLAKDDPLIFNAVISKLDAL